LGAARGYGRGEWLFKGFPADTKWERVLIEPADFGRLKYISRDADWLSLSGRTRLVQDGARNLDAHRRIAARAREARRVLERGAADHRAGPGHGRADPGRSGRRRAGRGRRPHAGDGLRGPGGSPVSVLRRTVSVDEPVELHLNRFFAGRGKNRPSAGLSRTIVG